MILAGGLDPGEHRRRRADRRRRGASTCRPESSRRPARRTRSRSSASSSGPGPPRRCPYLGPTTSSRTTGPTSERRSERGGEPRCCGADRARAVRRVRRAVRPRDAGAGVRGAGGRVPRGLGRRRVPSASTTTILRDYAGRPSLLTECHNLGQRARRPPAAQARGPQPHRLAQDQQRPRPGAARQADGQAAVHRRDRRRPARRRHGHGGGADGPRVQGVHGRGRRRSARSSTCSACACSAPRSRPSRAAAARSRTPSTRRCATGSPTSSRHYYCLGSVMGPHPYPWMVREFHRVIGDEAREQCQALTGGDPDVVVACVGGGSNAIGLFSGFVDTDARLVGVEPAGGAAVGRGVPGVVHGMRSYLMQDEYGQVEEAAVDLRRARLPGRRARALLPARHRPGRVPAGERRRGARRVHPARPHRGDHRRLRVGPRHRLGGPRGAVARRPDRARQPLGPRRQGRRPGDGAARRDRSHA